MANTLLQAALFEFAFIDHTHTNVITDTVWTVIFLLLSISEGNSVSQMLCTVSSLIIPTCIGGGLLFTFCPFL